MISRLRELCVIAPCGHPARTRKMCHAHYKRWRLGKDLSPPLRYDIDWRDRFWSYVKKTDSCWLWTGEILRDGYGRITLDTKHHQVHRISYELLIGPIPEGLTLDHLCRVRHCVNPDHLEPVTGRINILRGDGRAALNARKTHCLRGHPFNHENTYVLNGKRSCRRCSAQRDKNRRAELLDALKGLEE